MNKYTQILIEKGNQIKALKQEKENIEMELEQILSNKNYNNEANFYSKKQTMEERIKTLKEIKSILEVGKNLKRRYFKTGIIATPIILGLEILVSILTGGESLLLAIIVGILGPVLISSANILKVAFIMKKHNLEDIEKRLETIEQNKLNLEKSYETDKQRISEINERTILIEKTILNLAAEILNNSIILSGLSNTMKTEITEEQSKDCISPNERVLVIRRKDIKDSVN